MLFGRLEDSHPAWSDVLFKQLQILLNPTVKEGGWTIKSRVPEEVIEVYGPIPSMMLLLFSMIVEILESEGSGGGRCLEIGLAYEADSVEWNLSWPSSTGDGRVTLKHGQDRTGSFLGALRHDMIHDLSRACNAAFHEFEDLGTRHLSISGICRKLSSGVYTGQLLH